MKAVTFSPFKYITTVHLTHSPKKPQKSNFIQSTLYTSCRKRKKEGRKKDKPKGQIDCLNKNFVSIDMDIKLI
jgi:hypothetical protein